MLQNPTPVLFGSEKKLLNSVRESLFFQNPMLIKNSFQKTVLLPELIAIWSNIYRENQKGPT